jgi:signal transduction histidine kinase
MLTPLNGILGFAALMMDEEMVFEPHEIQDFARNINISALRLHRLIENFIIYSELELVASDPAKVGELRKSEPILTSEIVVRLAREKAGPPGRDSDLSFEVNEAVVAMPVQYFKKAVEELVDNAIKFSKTGAPVKVSSGPANDKFVLSVSDRGRGMTPAQIADVGAHMQFERRFYEQQGVGLGLIIAKRLAALHGGDLDIESTPGEHTTVRLTLPLASDAK